MCISYLLREGWWHGVGHHCWWWWWRLLALWWWRLRVKWEGWVVHTILSSPLHATELRGALEALVTKGTHLVCWSTKITLSIGVVIVVAIATTRVTTITSTAATILSFIATKGTFWPTPKPSIVVPIPVATTTKVAPPTPRIPIPTVILVATSSPPSTT